MNEITRLIQNAWAKRSSWSPEQVRQLLQSVVDRVEGAYMDWEEGDEEWGRVICDKQPILLASVLFPLVVVLSPYWNIVTSMILPKSVVLFEVSDFDDKVYCAEKTILEQIYERKLSSNINYNSMSINDLWWATV